MELRYSYVGFDWRKAFVNEMKNAKYYEESKRIKINNESQSFTLEMLLSDEPTDLNLRLWTTNNSPVKYVSVSFYMTW